MKFTKSKQTYEEPEIVGSKYSKRNIAAGVVRAFAVRQTLNQAQAVKTKIVWTTTAYMVLLVLGILAILFLLGVALFTLLPEVLAGIIITIIAVPALMTSYFIIQGMRLLHPKKKQSWFKR